jgi:hypothetical protein
MESRFGHSFARVRVHHDSLAAASAKAVNANAYTVGRDIVFAAGRYAPQTPHGRQLLAHELAHVVQQGGEDARTSDLRIAPGGSSPQEAEAEAAGARVGRPVTPSGPHNRHPAAVQRQKAGEEEKKEPTAPMPPKPQLKLDPAIQAQALALQTEAMLDPARVRLSLTQMNYDSILSSTPPPWLTAPSLPKPADLVPRGAGPETPRPASPSDVLQGLMKIPTVDQTLTSLQKDATSRLKSDWQSLTTGEKVAVITQSAVVGAAAIAGIASNHEGRQLALGLLQDKSLPTGVPGLNFQFNATGPDQRVKFDLNLGQFLPRNWGFH